MQINLIKLDLFVDEINLVIKIFVILEIIETSHNYN